jgi:hypothetical protein
LRWVVWKFGPEEARIGEDDILAIYVYLSVDLASFA